MRLSDILSQPLSEKFVQVEGFLDNRRLGLGKQAKITVGRIALNFFCRNCNDDRTFCSDDKLFCLGVNDHLISIDSVLQCARCKSPTSVQIWYLVECDGSIFSQAPEVRILKRSEKLSNNALFCGEKYGDFSELLEKSQQAYYEELGAGSVVYLRKIYEEITVQVAKARGIDVKNKNGNGRRRNFSNLLKDVDEQCHIIPREYTENGYRLFSQLSEILHGDFDEDLALKSYGALRRLVIGIMENVRNNNEFTNAISLLGWQDKGEPQ